MQHLIGEQQEEAVECLRSVPCRHKIFDYGGQGPRYVQQPTVLYHRR